MDGGADLALVGLAAIGGGAANALAGGGTLLTFPALLAAGVPPLAANVTNTVALCPGYLGAALAQRDDLVGRGRWLARAVPAGLIGGFAGALLLLRTGERVFGALVPYLILVASLLVAAQGPVRRAIDRRAAADRPGGWAVPAAGVAGIYGGYFGAGVSVVLLAVLGLALDEPLRRLNALKQVLALSFNAAAAILFVFSGRVSWTAAAVMAAGALLGGALGGRLAGRVSPGVLRAIVVAIGVLAGIAALRR